MNELMPTTITKNALITPTTTPITSAATTPTTNNSLPQRRAPGRLRAVLRFVRGLRGLAREGLRRVFFAAINRFGLSGRPAVRRNGIRIG